MLIVILVTARKHDEFIQIYQTYFTSDSGEVNVHIPLKGFQFIAQSEGHPHVSIRAHVSGEALLVEISCRNGYLTIASVVIRPEKDNRFPDTINYLIHSRQWVRISHRGFVRSPVVDKETKRSIAPCKKLNLSSTF